MAIETEIKFTVPKRELFDTILSLKDIAGYKTSDIGLITISDTYFDTPDNLLFKEKVVFRLRTAGKKPILTFKSQQKSSGSFFKRLEIESPAEITADEIVSGSFPEIPPCRAFFEKFGHVPLTVSLKAENNRRKILLEKNDIQHFELVLDDVIFIGPRGTYPICELEVESLDGTDGELEKIGAWLKGRFDLQYAGPSKYILGMKKVGTA
ncbi:CYTH domain-containing protein [Candidatus Latescibacterota bacterium]